MSHLGKQRQQPRTSAGTFTILSPADGASLVLGRIRPGGRAGSRGFASEDRARATARRLGEGWEAWRAPGSSARWLVRRLPRPPYDPATASATYTVLGAADEVMARFVTADAVSALLHRARGDALVFDDRDGNRVIAGTDGAPATLAMVEPLLDDNEATHVIAGHVVGYFADSNQPGRAFTLAQLDYDPAQNPLDPRDVGAIAALAPGESHQPLAGDPDEGPLWGIVTRLSAATQAKALVRACVVLGIGFDEAQARADAAERNAADAGAADGEMVGATLAALSGWHDAELCDRVYVAPDGTVRRIDVFDVLPHDEGTPNDPRWGSDDGAEPEGEDAAPVAG